MTYGLHAAAEHVANIGDLILMGARHISHKRRRGDSLKLSRHRLDNFNDPYHRLQQRLVQYFQDKLCGLNIGR